MNTDQSSDSGEESRFHSVPSTTAGERAARAHRREQERILAEIGKERILAEIGKERESEGDTTLTEAPVSSKYSLKWNVVAKKRMTPTPNTPAPIVVRDNANTNLNLEGWPRYEGDKPFNRFLRNLVERANACGLSEARMIRVLPLLLGEEQKLQYDDLADDVKQDWKKLQDELKNRFHSKTKSVIKMEELTRLKQENKESVKMFARRIMDTVEEAYPDSTAEILNSVKREHFLRGVKKTLKKRLWEKEKLDGTFDALVENAHNEEAVASLFDDSDDVVEKIVSEVARLSTKSDPKKTQKEEDLAKMFDKMDYVEKGVHEVSRMAVSEDGYGERYTRDMDHTHWRERGQSQRTDYNRGRWSERYERDNPYLNGRRTEERYRPERDYYDDDYDDVKRDCYNDHGRYGRHGDGRRRGEDDYEDDYYN